MNRLLLELLRIPLLIRPGHQLLDLSGTLVLANDADIGGEDDQ